MKNVIIIYLAVTGILFSCHGKKNNDEGIGNFPPVVVITTKMNVDFLPTLENPISSPQNLVYVSTLCIGWQTALDHYGRPVRFEDPNNAIKWLNRSGTWQNSLKKINTKFAWKRLMAWICK